MYIKGKYEIRKSCDNIKKLFFSLIYETPAVITNHCSLIYNVGGELVKIWWTIKRESHLKSQSCDLYGKHPFDRTKVVLMGWLGNTWSIDNRMDIHSI